MTKSRPMHAPYLLYRHDRKPFFFCRMPQVWILGEGLRARAWTCVRFSLSLSLSLFSCGITRAIQQIKCNHYQSGSLSFFLQVYLVSLLLCLWQASVLAPLCRLICCSALSKKPQGKGKRRGQGQLRAGALKARDQRGPKEKKEERATQFWAAAGPALVLLCASQKKQKVR